MKQTLKKIKNDDGFTLIETTIVLVVIAMLSLLILPNITNVTENVTNSTDSAIVATVEAQMELYKSNKKNETATFSDLVDAKYITQKQLDAYNAADKE